MRWVLDVDLRRYSIVKLVVGSGSDASNRFVLSITWAYIRPFTLKATIPSTLNAAVASLSKAGASQSMVEMCELL
jgi:hypothetical protein